MRILGIDEAGRGCVIGPLVLCGVVVDEEHLAGLLDLGVRDSKKLSSDYREDLNFKIIKIARAHTSRLIKPSEIDGAGLDFLEAAEISSIISELSPQKVFFDVPTHPAGVSNFVKSVSGRVGSDIELIGENKADEKFPVVSAASILAKVERDRIVAELRKEYGDFGSGYLSDSKTQDFLRVWFEKLGDFPPIVRRKWSSVQKFLVEQQNLL